MVCQAQIAETRRSERAILADMDRLMRVGFARMLHCGCIGSMNPRKWLTGTEREMLEALERELIEHDDGEAMLKSWKGMWRAKAKRR